MTVLEADDFLRITLSEFLDEFKLFMLKAERYRFFKGWNWITLSDLVSFRLRLKRLGEVRLCLLAVNLSFFEAVVVLCLAWALLGKCVNEWACFKLPNFRVNVKDVLLKSVEYAPVVGSFE